MSAYASVVTSPATWTCPVVIRVSTATRLEGSWASSASRIESLMASAILSGCPSVTDSDVNRRRDTSAPSGEGNGRCPLYRRTPTPGSAAHAAAVDRVGIIDDLVALLRRRREAGLQDQPGGAQPV